MARALRYAKIFQLNLDSPSLYGLGENYVRWVDKYFPHDIQDILIAVNQKQGVEENDHKVDFGDDDDTDIEIENFSWK